MVEAKILMIYSFCYLFLMMILYKTYSATMHEAKGQINFVFFYWVFYLAVPYMNNLNVLSER